MNGRVIRPLLTPRTALRGLNRLWVQLTAAFAAVVLVGVLIILAIGSVLNQSTALQALPLGSLTAPGGITERLADYYNSHNGWAGVEDFLTGAESSMPPGANLALVLITPDGTVYHSYPPHERLSIAADGSFVPVTSVPTAQPGVDPPFDPAQLPKIASVPIYANGVLRGTLNSYQVTPQAIAQTLALRQLRDLLLIIAAVNAVLGLLFGILFSRSLAAPLRQLLNAAESIAQRDLSRRVTPTGSQEFVAVANAFNAMAAALEEAEQLRRNMVADVAHELRTPLSVLQGNLQAILDGVYPLEESEIARLFAQTHLLTRLVDDLHALTLADAHQLRLNPVPTDIAPILRQLAEAFASTAEVDGITIRLDLPDNLPHLPLDSIRISQVFSNLLSNAVRHMPNGGQITIRARLSNGHLQVAVIDQGEGIAPEHLRHIFDRFYRVDKSRARTMGGAGLGLAIVRALVEAHNGTISAASDGINGHGSTFTVDLPVT